MPLFDICCDACGEEWEHLQIRSDDFPVCPKCQSSKVHKLFTTFKIRMDAAVMKHELPDPCPPLEELRGKQREGCEGGYADKPYADTQLKNYDRTRDKQGNIIWTEKKRQYFDCGKRRKGRDA